MNERMNLSPRSVDTDIATILYIASNPKLIQGDVLELSCGGTAGASGVVGLLGCIAARLSLMSPEELAKFKKERKDEQERAEDELSLLNSSKQQKANLSEVFHRRVNHLTLSDESPESLQAVSEMIGRHFFTSDSSEPPVSVEQIVWRYPHRRKTQNSRQYDHEYRTILGSDLDLSFPIVKELAKTYVLLYCSSTQNRAVVSC